MWSCWIWVCREWTRYEIAKRESGNLSMSLRLLDTAKMLHAARSAEAGVDTHLLKPADPIALLKLLDELCLDEVRARYLRSRPV